MILKEEIAFFLHLFSSHIFPSVHQLMTQENVFLLIIHDLFWVKENQILLTEHFISWLLTCNTWCLLFNIRNRNTQPRALILTDILFISRAIQQQFSFEWDMMPKNAQVSPLSFKVLEMKWSSSMKERLEILWNWCEDQIKRRICRQK